MRKKIIVAILFIANITSGCCGQNNGFEQQKMLGEWHLCKIYNGKIATNFNVCPDISFKENSKGFLHTGSIYEFNWKISADIIYIKFDKKLDDKDIMLGLSGCTVIYRYNEKQEYLELEDIKANRRYILSRPK